MDEANELNALLKKQNYYCTGCGAKMIYPTMNTVAYHSIDGTPIYQGKYKCSKKRWYNSHHDELLVQYKNCNLMVFSSDDGRWKFHERLWLHELKEKQ